MMTKKTVSVSFLLLKYYVNLKKRCFLDKISVPRDFYPFCLAIYSIEIATICLLFCKLLMFSTSCN